MAHERKVLESFPFLETNSRWSGSVDVVHRTSTFEDSGNKREFIDLVLKVGERFINLPIKDLGKVIEQLQAAQPIAEEKLRALVSSQPRPRPDQRGDRRTDRRGYHNRGDE